MKIIHIIYDSVGNPWLNGGGAHRTQELYKRLSRKYNVVVYTGNYKNAKGIIDGVKYKRIGLSQSYLISRLSFFCLIYFYVIFSKADLYIEDLGVPFPLGLSLIKRNLVASLQWFPNRSYIEKRGIFGLIVFILFRFSIKFYNRFITVSPYCSNFIKKVNNNAKINIISNGINMPKEIKRKKKDSYILFMGRIDIISKGIDTLLKAISYLKNNGTEIKLIIMGSGEENEMKKAKQMVKRLKIENNTFFAGYLTNEKKHRVLRDCYFVVVPSRNEPFGIVALEGMSYGKAIIGSLTGGLQETLTSSKGGLLFKVGDYKSLAKKIKLLLNNEAFAKKLGQLGRNYSLHFSWDKIAKDQEKIILSSIV